MTAYVLYDYMYVCYTSLNALLASIYRRGSSVSETVLSEGKIMQFNVWTEGGKNRRYSNSACEREDILYERNKRGGVREKIPH